jgi:hypothetical protein
MGKPFRRLSFARLRTTLKDNTEMDFRKEAYDTSWI